MRGLVQELAVFGRAGTGEVDRSDVSLAAIVEAVAPPAVADRGAVLVTGELPALQANADHLRLVLRRLVDNAVRFVPDGRVAEVSIWATTEPHGWIVAVEDNGPGVLAALRESIFDPFVRGDRGHAGSGLGLATARRLVARDGGHLWVEDRADGAPGASFRFFLPAHVTSGP
jgi:signal transduction histidine kinase